MGIRLHERIFHRITKLLMKDQPTKRLSLIDFERLCYEVRPGDVLLVAGRSRVSEVVRMVTLSPWSHAALYIGRLYEIADIKLRKKITSTARVAPDDQLLIESIMGKGTIITPITHYTDDHIRICRPRQISKLDVDKIIAYTINHLGRDYDVRQIMDLFRYMFPWSVFPRRWRSSLFAHNAGLPTKETCATLIAQAFSSVDFPIMPIAKKTEGGETEYLRLSPKLFTPADFDFSPYFDIIKYPVYELELSQGYYHRLPWKENQFGDTEGNVYAEPPATNKDTDEKYSL